MSKKDVLARLAGNVNLIHKLVKDAAARSDIDTLEILDSYLTQAIEDARADSYSVTHSPRVTHTITAWDKQRGRYVDEQIAYNDASPYVLHGPHDAVSDAF